MNTFTGVGVFSFLPLGFAPRALPPSFFGCRSVVPQAQRPPHPKKQRQKIKTGASTERASPDNNERAPSEKVVKARNAREAVALITCERVLLVEHMTYIEFIEEQLKTIWDSLSGIAAEHEQINEALQELSRIVAENENVYVEPEGGGQLTKSLK